MLTVKSLKNIKFKDAIGIFEYTGRQYALYEEGKGFVSLDGGESVYIPRGGKYALQSIIDNGGFCGEVSYIQAIA